MSALSKSPYGIVAVVVGFLGFLGAVVAEVLTNHDPTATIAIVSSIVGASGLLGAKQKEIGKQTNGTLSALRAENVSLHQTIAQFAAHTDQTTATKLLATSPDPVTPLPADTTPEAPDAPDVSAPVK